MNLARRSFPGVAAVGVAVLLVASASTAAAQFNLRAPQVPFNGAALQGYLNGIGESINVSTDQVDAQMWTTGASGNSTFTLMIEVTGNAGANSIGVYNTNGGPVPPQFQIFPPATAPGWHALAHFSAGNLTVSLFDQNATFMGQTFYPGVNASSFGFYLSGPGGTFYTEDSRNGGAAQMLTYMGTGVNFGEWWECFEDSPYAGGDQDFDDAVLLMQSVVPTDIDPRSWGRVKRLYRR